MKLIPTVSFEIFTVLAFIRHGLEAEAYFFAPQGVLNARRSIAVIHTTTFPSSRCVHTSITPPRLFMAPLNNEDDDEEDEDDADIDIDLLGDWRAFRMNLAGGEDKESGRGKPAERKSVSKQNEELLKTQNLDLAEEYISKVWVHEAPQPEVGGLVCRLPVEAEIYRNKSSRLGKKLHDRLSLDDNRGDYSDYEDRRMVASDEEMKEMDVEGASAGVSFSPLAAKTVFWYRTAQKLVKEEMSKIQKMANARNEIDASKLSPEALDVLKIYMDNQVRIAFSSRGLVLFCETLLQKKSNRM